MKTIHRESKPHGSGQPANLNQQTAGLSPQSKQVLIGLLSRAQVAQRLGTCPHTVQRLTKKGLLPALKFNSRLIRYDAAVLEAFIQSAAVGK